MDHIFPWGVMQLSFCWEVGLEMEGLESEPCVNQGFFSAQWPTPLY